MGGGIALSVNATNQQSNNGGNTMKFENINNKNLEDSFSTVHFSINGNDFGGGFFWNETKILATPQTIKDHDQREMICNGQIRGYYYNSQRGERLWPLDEDSKTELALIHRTYNKVSIK